MVRRIRLGRKRKRRSVPKIKKSIADQLEKRRRSHSHRSRKTKKPVKQKPRLVVVRNVECLWCGKNEPNSPLGIQEDVPLCVLCERKNVRVAQDGDILPLMVIGQTPNTIRGGKALFQIETKDGNPHGGIAMVVDMKTTWIVNCFSSCQRLMSVWCV